MCKCAACRGNLVRNGDFVFRLFTIYDLRRYRMTSVIPDTTNPGTTINGEVVMISRETGVSA